MKTNEMNNQNMFPISRHLLQAIALDIFDFAILNIQIIEHFMKNNQLDKIRCKNLLIKMDDSLTPEGSK